MLSVPRKNQFWSVEDRQKHLVREPTEQDLQACVDRGKEFALGSTFSGFKLIHLCVEAGAANLVSLLLSIGESAERVVTNESMKNFTPLLFLASCVAGLQPAEAYTESLSKYLSVAAVLLKKKSKLCVLGSFGLDCDGLPIKGNVLHFLFSWLSKEKVSLAACEFVQQFFELIFKHGCSQDFRDAILQTGKVRCLEPKFTHCDQSALCMIESLSQGSASIQRKNAVCLKEQMEWMLMHMRASQDANVQVGFRRGFGSTGKIKEIGGKRSARQFSLNGKSAEEFKGGDERSPDSPGDHCVSTTVHHKSTSVSSVSPETKLKLVSRKVDKKFPSTFNIGSPSSSAPKQSNDDLKSSSVSPQDKSTRATSSRRIPMISKSFSTPCDDERERPSCGSEVSPNSNADLSVDASDIAQGDPDDSTGIEMALDDLACAAFLTVPTDSSNRESGLLCEDIAPELHEELKCVCPQCGASVRGPRCQLAQTSLKVHLKQFCEGWGCTACKLRCGTFSQMISHFIQCSAGLASHASTVVEAHFAAFSGSGEALSFGMPTDLAQREIPVPLKNHDSDLDVAFRSSKRPRV